MGMIEVVYHLLKGLIPIIPYSCSSTTVSEVKPDIPDRCERFGDKRMGPRCLVVSVNFEWNHSKSHHLWPLLVQYGILIHHVVGYVRPCFEGQFTGFSRLVS